MFDARRMFDDRTCFPVAIAAALAIVSSSGCDRDSGASGESVESRAVAAKAGQDGGEESESGGVSESAPDEYPLDTLWAGRWSGREGDRIYIEVPVLPLPKNTRPDDWDPKEGGSYRAEMVEEPFRGVERVDVLTPEAPVELALEEIVVREYGPPSGSKTAYFVATESLGSEVEKFEHPTLVAQAGEMAEEASIEAAEPSHPGDEAANPLLDRVLQSLDPVVRDFLETGELEEGLSDEQLEELPDWIAARDNRSEPAPSIDQRHVQTLEGDFPAPHDELETVAGPEVVDGVGRKFPGLRAVRLADEEGNITESIYTSLYERILMGHVQVAKLEFGAVADPDADGTEGVLFTLDDKVRWVDFGPGGRVVTREFED